MIVITQLERKLKEDHIIRCLSIRDNIEYRVFTEPLMNPIQTQQSQSDTAKPQNRKSVPNVILEPTSVSVPIPGVPWYKRLLGQGSRSQTVWKLSFISVLLIMILVSLNAQQPQTIETRAGAIRARVLVLPASVILPPDAAIQLWVTTDVPLTRGELVVSFDSSKLEIQDVKLPKGSPYTKAVTITPLRTANETGKIHVVIPSSVGIVTPPTGTFEMFDMTFRSKSGQPNIITEVSLDPDTSTLYNNKTPFIITGVFKSTFILEPEQ
jgi:hypothetical protein